MIIRQSRVLFSIVIFVALFFPILLLPSAIENLFFRWIITVFGIIFLLATLVYFVHGRLKINFHEGTFQFVWEPKLFFKYKKIPDLKIHDIQKVVLDDEEIIRKIITIDREIILGHGKPNTFLGSDSQEFIKFLLEECENVRIVDSWDVWYEKGYLKWALRINTVIILFAVIAFVFIAVTKGIKSIAPIAFFMIIGFLSQLFIYQKQMIVKKKK